MRRLVSMLIVGVAAFAAGAQPTPTSPPSTVAERAQFFQRIASLDSTDELAGLAREAAASAGGLQQERLAVILERYYELDAPGAVVFAGELFRGADAIRVAPYYSRLAAADVNGALVVLSQLDDDAGARVAAMAVFRALGEDERARELVSASLQGSAREEFRAGTLLRFGSASPREAFDEAVALADPEKRRRLTMSIVTGWAQTSPRDALDAIDDIPDLELQAQLRAMVGNVYAQKDPESALAWARTLDPPNPQLLGTIVRGLAAKDPVRAFDVAESLEEPARWQAYVAAINAPLADQRQFETLADRVRALPDSEAKSGLLVSLVSSWAGRPGNAAPTIDWMIASGATLPAEAFERVGFLYAQSNPAGAAAYADRVPREARSAWVSSVTAAWAQTDLPSATAFIERLRGDPAYDRAALMLSQSMATTDPPAAARLLASVGTRGAAGPMPEIAIARQWAVRDPTAALAWALDLPPMTRTMVMQLTAATLAQQDTAALESWALRLPAGEKRDVALSAVLRARGAAPPNVALLNAFSDDRARQAALMATVLMTAQADTAAARRLIDEHITDARMRTQATQVVDGIERGDPAFPTGAMGMPPGITGVASPPFIGAVPMGTIPPGPAGQPITVIGPDGQPITLRPPIGASPVSSGSFIVAPPPAPPPVNGTRGEPLRRVETDAPRE